MIERTSHEIQHLVAAELAHFHDSRLRESLQSLLVSPCCHQRNWDYGQEGERYSCWTVAEHPASETAIVFSDYDFGPSMPWGLVWMKDSWFGMDSGWFETLEEAFRDSMAWDGGDYHDR